MRVIFPSTVLHLTSDSDILHLIYFLLFPRYQVFRMDTLYPLLPHAIFENRYEITRFLSERNAENLPRACLASLPYVLTTRFLFKCSLLTFKTNRPITP